MYTFHSEKRHISCIIEEMRHESSTEKINVNKIYDLVSTDS